MTTRAAKPTFKQFFKEYLKGYDVWNMGTLDYIKHRDTAKQIYDDTYGKPETIRLWN